MLLRETVNPARDQQGTHQGRPHKTLLMTEVFSGMHTCIDSTESMELMDSINPLVHGFLGTHDFIDSMESMEYVDSMESMESTTSMDPMDSRDAML